MPPAALLRSTCTTLTVFALYCHVLASSHVQILGAFKPLAHSIAEAGLILEAVPKKRLGGEEARALGAAFAGHELKRLQLRGNESSFAMDLGFLPALATALPALERLSLSRAKISNGESLQALQTALPCALPHLAWGREEASACTH